MFRDSIVSAGIGASGAENCFGPVSSAGHNLESRNQSKFVAAGDRVDTDPRLGPLADNGGPTLTLALLTGSPAIDAGLDCPAVDQRGVARPQGPGCDIGAFELVPTPPPPLTVTLVPAPPQAARIKFLGKKVRVDPATGKGNFKVSCGSDRGDHCQVTVAFRTKTPRHGAGASAAKRRSLLGTAAGTVAGGSVGRLKVKLNARGQALLAAAPTGFRVMATGTSRNRVRRRLRSPPRAEDRAPRPPPPLTPSGPAQGSLYFLK